MLCNESVADLISVTPSPSNDKLSRGRLLIQQLTDKTRPSSEDLLYFLIYYTIWATPVSFLSFALGFVFCTIPLYQLNSLGFWFDGLKTMIMQSFWKKKKNWVYHGIFPFIVKPERVFILDCNASRDFFRRLFFIFFFNFFSFSEVKRIVSLIT